MKPITSMKAVEVMTSPCITISKDMTLREAARVMTKAHCHSLIVEVDSELRSLGIITCKDVVQILADTGAEVLEELLVCDHMTSPLVTVQTDMPLDQCLALMRMTGTRRVPVMECSELRGILSYTDILRLVGA